MERQVFLHIFYKRDQGPSICRPLRYIKPCNVFFQCFNRFLNLAFSFSNPMDKHDPFFLVDLVESFPSLRLMSFQSRSLQKSSAFFALPQTVETKTAFGIGRGEWRGFMYLQWNRIPKIYEKSVDAYGIKSRCFAGFVSRNLRTNPPPSALSERQRV